MGAVRELPVAPDVVYLCRAGENEELRYSLRSLVNVPHGRVWLVGGRPPSWYTGESIRTVQHGLKKEITARAMIAACLDPRISDPFLLFNDDFYVMRPGPLPGPMHRGRLQTVIDWYESQGINSRYVAGMRATKKKLRALGIRQPLSYELHTPMLIDKLRMLGASRHGGHQRTMYGNLVGMGGRRIVDPKVLNFGDPIPDGRRLSSMDSTFPRVEAFLAERFPDPSPWESVA